jgi:CheY-like chemotaxis protein
VPAPATILHVDDHPDVLAEVADYLRLQTIEEWGTPRVRGMVEFEGALAELEAVRFDLVVLDVRLGGHEPEAVATPEEEAGVKVLTEIRTRRFVPIIFYTGLPAEVRHLEGPLVRVVEKSAGADALLAAMQDLFATGLPAVNRALLRLVEEEQRRYMWQFVAKHWDALRVGGDSTALAYLLARRLGRTLSPPGLERLATSLGEPTGRLAEVDKVHPVEMYVMPPLEGSPAQVGDLFEGEAGGRPGWWLLLTPSCDVQWSKADRVLLAGCQPLDARGELEAWTDRGKKAPSRLRDLLGHKTGGQDDRALYLPAAIDVPDLVADLQDLVTIPCAALGDMKRVASLDSPFAEAAVNRFGRYFGRVGTPDLDTDVVLDRLKGSAPPTGGDQH